MIDFQNASFAKLKEGMNQDLINLAGGFFVQGEQVIAAFQGVRDGVIFTTKRIIAINVQGLTGKKKDFTSIPYSKIQTFSVETAGGFDLDTELEIFISAVGKVKFEFSTKVDVLRICQFISAHIL